MGVSLPKQAILIVNAGSRRGADLFDQAREKLTAAGTEFVIAPNVRFRGQPGEQATMFFLDPSGNALEFKAFADDSMVFAK